MEFNDLIADFATRHNVSDLVAIDGAAALDIDGIIVTIVAREDVLNFSAEIGEPPAEGAGVFANLLLEANMQSGAFFAKVPDPGQYIAVRRLQLSQVDDDAFDAALEVFVNQVETWRRLLADFRPVAAAAAESAATESPSLGSAGFMQV
ncbi:MAG: type III secretion system chaperone [Kiritimatiellae bacterium]|nr:type III secretion system chaperone [Kiritimatiellia bacterium]